MFEVEGWVVLLLFGVVAYALSRKADRPGTQAPKKNNLKQQLSEQNYFMPKQRRLLLSDYGPYVEDGAKSYNDKLASDGSFKNGWKDLTWNEQEAYILSHFDIVQQFLNGINEHFIVELTDETMGSLNQSYDSPYTAVTLLIYRGKTNVGRIEIEPETLDDAPAATIHCSLEYAEMFNYEAVYSLLYEVGSIHLDDEDRYSAENLKLRITQTLTQFLWDRLNSTAEADYERDGYEWHKFEELRFEFYGEFKKLKEFRNKIMSHADLDPFKYEAQSIKNMMDHFGMEEVKRE